MDSLHYFLLLGTGLHTISLLGSSLVEEEHQTVYFLLNSLHIGLILKIIVQAFRGSVTSNMKIDVNVKVDDCSVRSGKIDNSSELPKQFIKINEDVTLLQKLRRPTNKLILLLIISLVLSRLMRSWNSTGDKWKHLEDLGDGIRAMGGYVLMFVVLFGLSISLLLFSRNCLPLVLVTCGCIFGRHYPYWGKDVSSGTFEAQVAHLAIVLLFVYGLFKSKLVDFRAHASKSLKILDIYEPEEEKIDILLRYSYTSLSLLCLLLQRADNIGLMSIMLLQNWVLSSVIYRLTLTKVISVDMAALAVNWLAFAHFFFQVSFLVFHCRANFTIC